MNKSIPELLFNDIFRFWTFVQKSDGCWNWSGCLVNSMDRPRFSVNNKRYICTRVMWKIVYGSDPGKLFVLHTCDNGNCVNPEHLYLGTQSDNLFDLHRGNPGVIGFKGKGEDHFQSKLSENDVKLIRENRYNKSQMQLAKEFGVCKSCIGKIQTNRNWSNV